MIEPLRGCVIVKVDTGEKKTASGIVASVDAWDGGYRVKTAVGEGIVICASSEPDKNGCVASAHVNVGDKVRWPKNNHSAYWKEGEDEFMVVKIGKIDWREVAV